MKHIVLQAFPTCFSRYNMIIVNVAIPALEEIIHDADAAHLHRERSPLIQPNRYHFGTGATPRALRHCGQAYTWRFARNLK
jgi:hypothetical protein